MNRKFFRILGACLVGGSLFAGCVAGEQQVEDVDSTYAPLISGGSSAIPGQYIVVFNDSVATASLTAAADDVAQYGDDSRLLRSYSVIPGFAARLSPHALADLRRNPDVAYVEEDTIVQINTVHPTSADGIDRVDQRQLPRDGQFNDYGNTGAGVHVIIVDTGIRSTHNEFGGRVAAGYTAINDGRGTEDCHGHGTHVASTAAGAQYGLAKQATLHASRVLDCNGSGSNSGVIAGVDWVRTTCTSNGWACVANMSLGGSATQALDDAVNNAVNAGITFAVAAGNDNANACNYSPARAAQAISVAAADDNDARASFSNYGSCVDIFAPGVSILGAWKDSNTSTNTISGTSMASPHVAGAAALYVGANPGATPAQVRDALINNAGINCISSANGSPNALLHNNFSAGQFDCGGGGGDPDPPGDDASCVGHCDGQAPAGCWCDIWCLFTGDCCEDMVLACF